MAADEEELKAAAVLLGGITDGKVILVVEHKVRGCHSCYFDVATRGHQHWCNRNELNFPPDRQGCSLPMFSCWKELPWPLTKKS